MKIILSQDDCAPNSFEYFEEQFIQMLEITISDFKKLSKESQDDMCFIWELNNYKLMHCADDPYYVLYDISAPVAQ